MKRTRTPDEANEGVHPFPANVDAERSILGAILLNNSLFSQVEALGQEDLFLDTHRRIFARMRDLADSKRPIDLITLVEELERHGEIETVGGVAYLSDLTNGVPERPSIAHYVRIVLDHASRRRFARNAENLQRLALDPAVPATALADAGSRLSEIAAGSKALPPRHSEEAVALRFTYQHADSLRYVNEWGCWMKWDGCRWREDCTLAVFDLVRAMCREASGECSNDERTGIRLASKVTVAAIERLIQSDRRHAALAEQWDLNPWLLNTPAGTVDLKDGTIHAHQPHQYITKLAASGPGGECPRWLRFLDRITGGDADLQSFLQRISGYCLTGSTKEHALFFMFGTGANGKSVFLSTLAGLLGDYARTAPVSIFTASNNEQHPTDLAGLRGARFVTAIETEDGRWWAEARIKSLTGGDRITARFMRQDFFEYVPQFKLIVAGNHKPGLRNVDEAMRRRLHLVPFTVTIAEQERDPDLTAKLQAEYPGILQWAIEGCLAWQREGLNPPSVVRDATRGYLAAEDVVGRWIEERCIQGQEFWTAGTFLYTDFQQWCEQAGERPGTRKRFSQTLEDRGFAHERTREARGFLGIGLATDVTDVTRSRVISVHARV